MKLDEVQEGTMRQGVKRDRKMFQQKASRATTEKCSDRGKNKEKWQ